VNRKEIEESTGLYMDAGTGTKRELYRQADLGNKSEDIQTAMAPTMALGAESG
jgi:hypothetical protein